MPIPVSVTSQRRRTRPAPYSVQYAVSLTSPISVNLMALFSRLVRICRTRDASPMTRRGSDGAGSILSSTRFSSAWGSSIWLTSRTSSGSSNGSFSRAISSASIFDRSSTLLMTPSSARPANWILARNWRCSSVSAVCSSRYPRPMTALSGVRSSWLMLARNWLFDLLARSAAASASRSSCSSLHRSVMSWIAPTILAGTPFSLSTSAAIRIQIARFLAVTIGISRS